MEFAMTDEFRNRYLNNIDRTLVRVEDKIDKNTALTGHVKDEVILINSRVSKLETWRSTFKNQPDPKNLPSPWKDPTLIRIALMIVLAIVLGLTGIRVAGLSL